MLFNRLAVVCTIDQPAMRDALPEELSGCAHDPARLGSKLAVWLRSNKNKRAAGGYMLKSDDSGRAKLWFVHKTGAS